MNLTSKHPWYLVRWQIWVISLVAILVIATFRYQSTRPVEIKVKSVPTGQTKTLKNRMIFIVILQKSMHKKGWIASLDLEGEDGNILKIYWESINPPFVRQMLKSTELIQDIREMGFKRLVLNNGKEKWDIDLKN
ncbi:MAG: hypothetical protein JZU65_22130 [Chlorobium sp.]|nr:hypothetical protein [Chlorobium sp.]